MVEKIKLSKAAKEIISNKNKNLGLNLDDIFKQFGLNKK